MYDYPYVNPKLMDLSFNHYKKFNISSKSDF